MIPNELQWLVLGGLGGVLLGSFYFGGLWFTVCRLPRTASPEKWLIFSFVVRLVPTLTGLWLTLRVDTGAFFTALAVFFIVRRLMIKRFGPVISSPRPDSLSSSSGK